MKKPQKHSKRLDDNLLALLWVVTVGGLMLAAMCIWRGYLWGLPWVSAMVCVAWITYGGKKWIEKQRQYSQELITDVRALLWVVTLGGLALAGLCIVTGYMGSLPWIAAMVGLPWTAHGVICSCYMSMSKSDHREGGITFEAAKANNFRTDGERSKSTPTI